jgi:hypothetical protein
MNEVVDRILNSYELMRPLSAERVADSRQKVNRYLESLASAGQRGLASPHGARIHTSCSSSVVKITDTALGWGFGVAGECAAPAITVIIKPQKWPSSGLLSLAFT